MTGPAAWDALRERLANASDAIETARADVDRARASLAAATDAIHQLYAGEEELDPRLAARTTDLADALQLYRHSDRIAGLDRLRQQTLDLIGQISSPLYSTDAVSTFVFARAFVDTIAVELAELVRSYEDPGDDA
jgi:hypothetical protein